MLLSCIVPIYNRETTLHECLDSLRAIHSNEVEFLLVDDGSEDDSLSVCRQYAEMDSRFRVIHQENGGVGSARNRGIALSQGKFFFFVDSDDMVIPETVEAFLGRKSHTYDLYCFDYYLNDQETYQKRSLREQPNLGLLASFLYENNNNTWNNIYRASVVRDYGILFDKTMKMGEDLLFNITFLQRMKNWIYVEKPLYLYRDNTTGSAINTYKFSYIRDYIRMFEKLYPYYIQTDFKKNVDWIVYLNGIFINAFSTTGDWDDRILDELEKSRLFYEIADVPMTEMKMKFKLFCVRHRLYRYPLIVRLVRRFFY